MLYKVRRVPVILYSLWRLLSKEQSVLQVVLYTVKLLPP